MSKRIPVELGERSYDAVIAEHYDALRDFVRGRRRLALVMQVDVGRNVGALLGPALDAAAVPLERFLIGEGEDAKSLQTIEQLTRDFARWGLLRGDLVLAVGGGV